MKILVIRLSSIGDIILTEPVIRHLRKSFPGCSIDYLTKKQFSPLIQSFQGIENIFQYSGMKKSLKELEGNNYDLIIDLHSKLKTWLIKSKINADRKISYRKNHLLRSLMVMKLTKREIDTTVKSYFTVFKKLKIEYSDACFYPEIHPTDNLQDNSLYEVIDRLREKGRILVAVFLGATHKTKRYPYEQWAEFFNFFADDKRFLFVLLGSEPDNDIVEKLLELCIERPVNLCGKYNLQHLLAVMQFFDIIMTNDSGPMHIAAALGKKQIAIFGATHPKLGFRPMNDDAVIIQSELSCRPCSLHGGERCPRKHFLCMRKISPEILKKALIRLSDLS